MSEIDYVLDGSLLEGGGQVLRNSIALGALKGWNLRFEKIRAGRTKPGLKRQHLTGIQLVTRMVNGDLQGGAVDATEIEFRPQSMRSTVPPGGFQADTKTAGSICLLAQVSLPLMLCGRAGESAVAHLKGGTNAQGAPQIDYTIHVFAPMLKLMAEPAGGAVTLGIPRRGFYPRGGGYVTMDVKPVTEPLHPIVLKERGHVVAVEFYAFSAGKLPRRLTDIMVKRAEGMIVATLAKLEPDTAESVRYVFNTEFVEDCDGSGAGLLAVAITSTGCRIGASQVVERGRKAEDVATDVGETLAKELQHGGCVDEYLADQLIIFMALAKGKSSVLAGPISLHTETALHFVGMLTKAVFTVTKVEPDKHLIECEGEGFSARQ